MEENTDGYDGSGRFLSFASAFCGGLEGATKIRSVSGPKDGRKMDGITGAELVKNERTYRLLHRPLVDEKREHNAPPYAKSNRPWRPEGCMIAVEGEEEGFRGQPRCRMMGKGEAGRKTSREVAWVNACIVAGGRKKPNVSPACQRPHSPPSSSRDPNGFRV